MVPASLSFIVFRLSLLDRDKFGNYTLGFGGLRNDNDKREAALIIFICLDLQRSRQSAPNNEGSLSRNMTDHIRLVRDRVSTDFGFTAR